ncbi:MAG: 50S ribosomal protein L18 [Halobacteriales archaeon]|nr:50S ribosomal protein L18 [Halobacteriales archaeon]
MATGARYKVPMRRRREGRTDYGQRLRLLKSGQPRFVVRKSNRHTHVQVVVARDEGDHTVANAHTSELSNFGWEAPTGNLPSAYLVGRIAGARALDEGHEQAVLDIGLNRVTPANRVFAVLSGAVDAGVDIPHGEEVLPSWERVRGEHIAEGVEYEAQPIEASELPEHFDEVLEAVEAEL